MKKYVMILLLLSFLLASSTCAGAEGEDMTTLDISQWYREAWPASREEVADLNQTVLLGSREDITESWAMLWAQGNYGEDAVILSMACVDTGTTIDLITMLGYNESLFLKTWEIQLIPGTLPEDPESPEGALTVSVQVVCIVGEYEKGKRPCTLYDFMPPEQSFNDLREVHAYLRQDSRYMDLLGEELRTVVPEDVVEIDLREALGDDVSSIRDVWMLNANTCVAVRWAKSSEVYEVIVLDLGSMRVLARMMTPYKHAAWFGLNRDLSTEDGVYYLEYVLPEDCETDWYIEKYYYVKISVWSDGTAELDHAAPNKSTIMPGGKTAVYGGSDGSLYVVDLDTGTEEILLHGFTREASWVGEPTEYIPFWDELSKDGLDDRANFIQYNPDNDSVNCHRAFSVYKALDEHRFVYVVSGWECGAGFGVYDLETRTDHRITAQGRFYGMGEGMVLGSNLVADVNSYETSPISDGVWYVFEWIELNLVDGDYYDISPDGKFLAFMERQAWRDDAYTLSIIDVLTGDTLQTYDIENPFAIDSKVEFYEEERWMLFFYPRDMGSAYLYLFTLGE